jgi:drug/metabolite transporter (DMT)-like permease
MEASATAATIFGLSSALCWGAGDFGGGLASRRANVYAVVLLSKLLGITLLAAIALALSEPFPLRIDLILGAVAGIVGTAGLVALYRGLASGTMGVVAPLTAIVTAAIPVLVGIFLEGPPAASQLSGFVLALLAVWLISRTGTQALVFRSDLILPLTAGLGFGLFLVLIGYVSKGSVLWPLVAARAASISLLLPIVLLPSRQRRPALSQFSLIVLVGLFETGGNAFYALAARTGRLDAAAVLGSLYPAATVLLARLLLKEELSRRQWLGVTAALVAVLLIVSW